MVLEYPTSIVCISAVGAPPPRLDAVVGAFAPCSFRSRRPLAFFIGLLVNDLNGLKHPEGPAPLPISATYLFTSATTRRAPPPPDRRGGGVAPRHLYENVMEPTTGIEPVTPSLPRKCSTTEPRGLDFPDSLVRATDLIPARSRMIPVPPSPVTESSATTLIMERETGFGPATLSLEG